MIEVKNLVKRYGNHTAVDGLNFTIEEGKIYGFLGPNGAGKSTTMNMITGYIASTSGEVLINGCNILDDAEKAKKYIGYLPEQPPLYFDMTVREYLQFVAELKKVPKKDRETMIEEIMDVVKIKEMPNRLIRNLSKGYKQRVGLAQAIIGYPEIIILDEPTVGLDPKQIIEIRDLIKSLGKNHTVILSSHILSEVSAVCDYVLIIAHGKLVASDTPENLSKKAFEDDALELTVKGERDEIVSAVEAFENVDSVTVKESKEPGCVDLSVKTYDLADIREELFYRMAELHYPILKMEHIRATLEDIFLELTERPEDVDRSGEEQLDMEIGEEEDHDSNL
ncbi:MAG TPA: ABC transporter ATP-binding protein [Candidatus Egerieimonas faecigallinarum]|nr:ABC transporter ATP-binding protein [Candidatus Egerieimonas faecigallinarum]